MKLNTPSLNKFWNDLPLISSLLIAANILMYVGWLLDHSFFDVAVPGLDNIRNGRYFGLLTSGLFDNRIIFLVWGIGWIWNLGKSIETRVSVSFFLFLVTSSIVFPELFETLIFERTSYGTSGIVYSLFGFTWIMSVYEPAGWSASRAQRSVLIAAIFLGILLDYTEIYELSIASPVGGLLWGVFVGFVSRSVKIKALRFAIPTFALGLFLIPVFWAPWQVSWLLHKAEKYNKQGQLVKEREFLYRVLKKDPENERAKEDIRALKLFEEGQENINQGDFEKAKKAFLQILEIKPDDQNTKRNLQILELYQDYVKYYDQQDFDKAESALSQILEIDPNNQYIKQRLQIIQLHKDFLKYCEQREFDKAESALSQILEIQPDDGNTKKNLQGVRLWNEFFTSQKNNDFNKAKDALSQILELYPNNEEAKTYLKEIKNQTKTKGAY